MEATMNCREHVWVTLWVIRAQAREVSKVICPRCNVTTYQERRAS